MGTYCSPLRPLWTLMKDLETFRPLITNSHYSRIRLRVLFILPSSPLRPVLFSSFVSLFRVPPEPSRLYRLILWLFKLLFLVFPLSVFSSHFSFLRSLCQLWPFRLDSLDSLIFDIDTRRIWDKRCKKTDTSYSEHISQHTLFIHVLTISIPQSFRWSNPGSPIFPK